MTHRTVAVLCNEARSLGPPKCAILFKVTRHHRGGAGQEEIADKQLEPNYGHTWQGRLKFCRPCKAEDGIHRGIQEVMVFLRFADLKQDVKNDDTKRGVLRRVG